MAFTRETGFTRTPTSIGAIEIHLFQIASEPTILSAAYVDFQILDATGGVFAERKSRDMVPHLSAAELTTLKNILNGIRARLVADVLP